MSVPGTFKRMSPSKQSRFKLTDEAEYIVSPADFVSVIREDLKPEAVAPLLCGMLVQYTPLEDADFSAGLTMYGALNRLGQYCNLGEWVAIMGAGGGLGHLYDYTL